MTAEAWSLQGNEAPREAREVVRNLLVDRPADVVEVAILLTSELVTNAVVHTHNAARMEAATEDDMLRVRIADCDSSLPELMPESFGRGNGRGIAIIDALATAWGVERRGPVGKSVWFELSLEGNRSPRGLHRNGATGASPARSRTVPNAPPAHRPRRALAGPS
ncbi:MAG: ATP-binding region ATPase domain protein [Acidimicrobiaceae bacterium]|nr:ATP-binding region ATPase domain protein [Acidimicrobiaceae bacterium]